MIDYFLKLRSPINVLPKIHLIFCFVKKIQKNVIFVFDNLGKKYQLFFIVFIYLSSLERRSEIFHVFRNKCSKVSRVLRQKTQITSIAFEELISSLNHLVRNRVLLSLR